MKKIDLDGIFPPVPTPFEGGEVAHDRLVSNVEKWSGTGIRGVVVLGSNGEYIYLSEKEKIAVVDTVVKSVPEQVSVIAGTGCESLQETIKLTRACADKGVDAALVVSPHYYQGKMNRSALFSYYTEVADHSPIPILLYNVTKFTHINLDAALVADLSAHSNIVGIKDSSGNVSQLGEYLNMAATDFKVMVGTAGALFGALLLGCAGGVLACANVGPRDCVKLYDLVKAGDYTAARDLQLKLLPVNKAVTATYGVSGLKAALDMLGYFGGSPRLPLLPSTDQERSEIRLILTQADLIP
jgi:4-hydroxy-2-oxoglutarate aldolase